MPPVLPCPYGNSGAPYPAAGALLPCQPSPGVASTEEATFLTAGPLPWEQPVGEDTKAPLEMPLRNLASPRAPLGSALL